MTTTPPKPSPSKVMNVPNLLTAMRLLLSIVLFVVIALAQGLEATKWGLRSQLYWAAIVIFVIAAGTDWIDGFWARRYGQVTVLGRIFDPFVDKVIICGAFIFLVASPATATHPGSKVMAWMAVVVTGREMLVTVLRGIIEQQGTDFSAKMAGKLKMVLQCVAIVASLYLLTYSNPASRPPQWLLVTVDVSLGAAILLTLYSGAEYILAAIRLVRS